MEIGEIFTISVNNKQLEMKLVFNNKYIIVIELVTMDPFYPEKVIFEMFKDPLRKILEKTHGLFIKDNFSVSDEVMKKPNLIFALTSSGTVQFKPKRNLHENSYSGLFITPTPVVLNDEFLQSYFVIFK